MNGFNKRVRIFDVKTKTMLPSAPLYKCSFFAMDVSELILMFSIGLKDKSGLKEIYDGDICELWIKASCSCKIDSICGCGEIVFNNAQFKIKDKDYYNDYYWHLGSEDSYLILKGNIHENPELI